jgi:hypothetical protein
MLMDDHKTKQLGSVLKFLTHYAREGDEFLNSIVIGDETWVFHRTLELKQLSLQWCHTQCHMTERASHLVGLWHFKHISLKQNWFYHCQTSMAHR